MILITTAYDLGGSRQKGGEGLVIHEEAQRAELAPEIGIEGAGYGVDHDLS